MSWTIQNETKGNLPYLVIWISLNRLISTSHHTTIDSAERQYNHLKEIGREPTILAVLEPIQLTAPLDITTDKDVDNAADKIMEQYK